MNFAEVLEDNEGQNQSPEVLPAAAVLSLEAVKPSLIRYTKEVDRMVSDAKAIEIIDEDSLKVAVALGGNAKKIVKSLEAQEEIVTADAKGFVKSVSGFVKQFTEKLVWNTKKTNADSVEAVLKRKIADYQTKQEIERQKREAAARAAAEEVRKKMEAEVAAANRKAAEEAARKAEEETRKRLEAEKISKKKLEEEVAAAKAKALEEAEKNKIMVPEVNAPVVAPAETVTRTESGTSAYQAKTWKCYVDYPDQVPREYCVPDGRLLNQAVKQGIRTIPGCRIVEEKDTKFRT